MCAHIVQRRSILCCVVVLELSSFILIFLVANSCCLFCSQPASRPASQPARPKWSSFEYCEWVYLCFRSLFFWKFEICYADWLIRIDGANCFGFIFCTKAILCCLLIVVIICVTRRRRWLLNCDQIGPIFRCFASGIVLPKFRLFWGWFAVFALNRSDGRWVGRSVSW